MARGPRKNFSQQNRKPKHNWRNEGGERKKMLDMRRDKYFGFDLDDMLTEFELGDNKNTIAATIINKASSHSIDDAFDYISQLKTAGTLDNKKVDKLETLLQKYSKWR